LREHQRPDLCESRTPPFFRDQPFTRRRLCDARDLSLNAVHGAVHLRIHRGVDQASEHIAHIAAVGEQALKIEPEWRAAVNGGLKLTHFRFDRRSI
jgi:hypothetical protein